MFGRDLCVVGRCCYIAPKRVLVYPRSVVFLHELFRPSDIELLGRNVSISSVLDRLVRVLGWSEMVFDFLRLEVRAAGGLGHSLTVQLGE